MITHAKKEEMLNFHNKIEAIVRDKKCSYMDAILMFCEINDLEIERIPALISNSMQSKIEEEAGELNLIKTNGKAKMRL